MSLKRKDTPESAAYWRFIEETAAKVRAERPEWADRLLSEQSEVAALRAERNEAADAVDAIAASLGRETPNEVDPFDIDAQMIVAQIASLKSALAQATEELEERKKCSRRDSDDALRLIRERDEAREIARNMWSVVTPFTLTEKRYDDYLAASTAIASWPTRSRP